MEIGGVSIMAGVGFTMSLLVGNLGLGHTRTLEDEAKLGVLLASVISAGLALLVLRRHGTATQTTDDHDQPVLLDVPRFARGYGVRPCDVSGPLVGRTLAELDVRRRFGVTVIGVWRAGVPAGARNLEPMAADAAMASGEVLLVAGPDDAVERFLAFTRESRVA
jgi:Trk K+ transport system NAD-binding subunit